MTDRPRVCQILFRATSQSQQHFLQGSWVQRFGRRIWMLVWRSRFETDDTNKQDKKE